MTGYQTALKIISIIIIVFGALGILVSVFACAVGGGTAYVVGSGAMTSDIISVNGTDVVLTDSDYAMISTLIMAVAIASLVSSIFELVVGILGVRGANNPSKIGPFYVLAIIGLIINILSAIAQFSYAFQSGGDVFSGVLSSCVGIVLMAIVVFIASKVRAQVR